MRTRTATPADAEAIAALHAASWRATYRGVYDDMYLDRDVDSERLAHWRERLAESDPAHFTLLAERDGAPIGFIHVVGAEDAEYGSLIDNLHVAPDLKRSGVGRELMRAGAGWLVAAFSDLSVYLGVLEGNDNARSFYERLGGRYHSTFEDSPPGGGMAIVCRYTWVSPQALLDACGV
jgi:ribosomal protein S18 acetylase RimI-like enzyme